MRSGSIDERVLIFSAWTNSALPSWASAVAENHRRYADNWGYDYQLLSYDGNLVEETDIGPRPLSPFWAKVKALAFLMESSTNEFLFYIDLDSIFFDFSVSLRRHQNCGKPIVLTGDSWDVFNGGHLLVRNSPETRAFVASWWELSKRVFPRLNGDQTREGLVNDQVAMNYLLAGGLPSADAVRRDGARLFNQMNGYVGNPERKYRFFSHLFAPTTDRGAYLSRFLLGRDIRRLVKIVPQRLLNAYPVRLPGASIPRRPPIWHFPGQWKAMIPTYLDAVRGGLKP